MHAHPTAPPVARRRVRYRAPSAPSSRRSAVLFAAILVALVAGVYFPVAGHGFLHWDDDVYVFENPQVRTGLSPANLAWAFGLRSATWQPLTWISYMSDATVFGEGPRGFHSMNAFWHALAAVLLFLALRRMTGSRDPWASHACLLAAALFAVHPLNVEPVAWVAGRKDLLAAVFWFTTLLLYARFVERPTAGRYLGLVVAFACGLMSKPVTMTLPLVLLVLDAWPLRRAESWRRRILEKLPLFLLSAASLLVTFLAQRQAGAVVALDRFSAEERVANAVLSYALYLRDAVWPLRLAAFYPREPVPLAAALASGALLAALTILALAQRSRRPHLLAGWLWFVVALVPMSGLVQIGSHARADRFTYIPLAGVFLAAAWTLRPRLDRRAVRLTVLAVVLLLGVAAHRQARLWRDDATLFGHALRVTRGNFLAHMKLGAALAQAGRTDEALSHFRQAVTLQPRYLDAWYNYATVLNALRRRAEAIEAYEKALALAPGDPMLRRGLARAWNNRGVDAAQAGQLEEAIRCFEAAVRAAPDDGEAEGNLRRARAALGSALSPSGAGR